MKYSISRHGPLRISKGSTSVPVPGREDPRRTHICLLWTIGCPSTVFSLLWRQQRREQVKGATCRFFLASIATWLLAKPIVYSLVQFCFQIENLYRNEKNHHTQQWINNSCLVVARAIIFITFPNAVLIACEREFVLKLLIFKLHVKTTNCMACLSNKA